jgi:hypothetical protein
MRQRACVDAAPTTLLYADRVRSQTALELVNGGNPLSGRTQSAVAKSTQFVVNHQDAPTAFPV